MFTLTKDGKDICGLFLTVLFCMGAAMTFGEKFFIWFLCAYVISHAVTYYCIAERWVDTKAPGYSYHFLVCKWAFTVMIVAAALSLGLL